MCRGLFIPVCLAAVVLLASCSGTKNSIYFRPEEKMSDSGIYSEQIVRAPEVLIQPDDIIAINVSSESSIQAEGDPVAIYREGGTAFSLSATQGSAGGGSGAATARQGYLVDKEGFIDFPVAGKIKVGGLTIRQTKSLVAQKLDKVIKNPVVEVRILNFKVVMMGEVSNPGTVLAPNQSITIVEAIAAAGDIPLTGNKNNVLLIREEEGLRKHIRLNLNSRDIFSSPYYYLKQNDIIYVEANRIKRQQNNEFFRIYLPAITSVVSTLLAVYGIAQLSKQ